MLFRTQATIKAVDVFRQDGGLHRSVPTEPLTLAGLSGVELHAEAVRLATHTRDVTRLEPATEGWWWEVPLATRL